MTALPALANQLAVRPAQSTDLEGLVALENASFATDKLSRRSFRHWLSSDHRALLLAEWAGLVAGYILIIYHPGTRLARIYSLAVAPQLRGNGIAKTLMLAGEQAARDDGRLYLRLEVSVDNTPAIRLYEALGFQKFGLYRDYYQDHKDALRYQKRIRRYRDTPQHRSVHWLRQTTPFTCGPAALMMAMHALNKSYLPSREQEIELWREATTIFMTSGHGGCHPIGLALAAKRRRFSVEVWINQTGSLFIDSVRSEDKKQIVELVDTCFKREAAEQGVAIHYANITQNDLIAAFEAGAIPLILISTFSMDRKKAPHWVVMSGFDKDCLYMHDSDPDDGRQSELDCQFIPIAREDFDRMSCFGKSRLRTAVIVWPSA
ncbi:GNAT family N-acetyltransferase/peptidase C39 family protein [Methylomonas sp. MO1]|uniref:GNAT family N-acetyltransferase/peptidase C39 family protein n=1 Tax=unclassified Methylomonas TaxID=2608980 RepID=UPI00047A2A49|nr:MULTISPECIES: GNAT family N-acetyltransferase/peptidase C39 family protein [unclassified Methylomonas]MDT4292167.1 GNAT family N-acetyltransferase/peptidase C39 family protein [Methylomonas sp. MO1]